jgi:hypothetical protein
MDDMLTIMVDQERAFFNEEARRLNEFYPLTSQNQVADLIYQKWFLAYNTAIETYERFDKAAQSIKSGDLAETKQFVNLPKDAALTGNIEGDKRVLALLLINDFLPSSHLQKICKEQNRELINMIMRLSQQKPEAAEELDLLACWIATFPHKQKEEEPEAEKPGFFGGWLETALKVFAGYLIGSHQKKKGTGYTIQEGPPPYPEDEEEELEQQESY